MPLSPRTRLGPYEIVAPLGAGGMGEVYRARDTRLGREVALKTLPVALAQDAEYRARFEREARAVATLSHPNVLAIHDVDIDGEIAYVVFELVEGVTLRERLADGPISSTRAVPLAVQIANGLAAAHDRGVIHRDLKPDNVMVTPEGRAKILDFGLAKLDGPDQGAQSLGPTEPLETEPGALLGTVGYMSPEQLRGQAADARSDLFALGAIVYEMLAGRRAFSGSSPVETMGAILHDDPADLLTIVPAIPPALERIVFRCLEKMPASRFRSAADLAFALETVSTSTSSGATAGAAGLPSRSAPAFRRLTFRNGHVAGARFTPDGAAVVYGAAWDGRAHEIYMSRTGSPESRSLGLPAANVLAMSASGEVAISLGYHLTHWFEASGTLAQVPLAGEGVRPLQKDVGYADWSPDGKTMAVIRFHRGRCRLEYPAGTVRDEVDEWLSHCRVSPDGGQVAFGRHPRPGEVAADVCLAEMSGGVRVLASDITSLSGIAWSPTGDEVWWSGISSTQDNGIWAVSLDGVVREVYRSPVRVALHDIRSDGQVLLSVQDLRIGIAAGADADVPDHDLSWFDGSVVTDLSEDGEQVLFLEVLEAENPHYAAYLRGVDGSPAVRIGTGSFSKLSTGGQWVVGLVNDQPHALTLHPTGFGVSRTLSFDGFERLACAAFHPDGKHLLLVASSPERASRLYRTPIESADPELLLDEEILADPVVGLPISSDGDRIVLQSVSGEHFVFSVRESSTEPITVMGPDEASLRFDASGKILYVAGSSRNSRQVDRLDLASGERTPWRTLSPPNPTGVVYVTRPHITADGSRYTYSLLRVLSNLYVAEGLV